jgi:hypothetical protein
MTNLVDDSEAALSIPHPVRKGLRVIEIIPLDPDTTRLVAATMDAPGRCVQRIVIGEEHLRGRATRLFHARHAGDLRPISDSLVVALIEPRLGSNLWTRQRLGGVGLSESIAKEKGHEY